VKRKWKVILLIAGLLLVVIAASVAYKMKDRGVVTVQTGRSVRQDLTSVVTASGEIKPRNYVNIGANVMGRIIALEVKEGDHVRRDQVVARLESIQAEAQVQAQRAALTAAEADSAASEATVKSSDENLKVAQASVERAKAELNRAKADYSRAELLFKEQLIARQEFDQSRAQFDALNAAVREAEARLAQLRAQRQQSAAQLAGAQRRVAQMQATLRGSSDQLQKHLAISPINGVVTNLPVREGEVVVPGIQNSPASLIMTVADMSLITAEVKVDETDIVNVQLNQVAEVTVDAIPNKTFQGHVIEIGNTAILRSTGLAASQSAVSSQEAKDFKVVVALESPPGEIRPGLSCTAKVTTATRQKALTIPIQALTVRQRGDLEPPPKGGIGAVSANTDPAVLKARKEELQGVFVINGENAQFREVKTGITGATDVEVLSGLKEGDEIVTGSYRVIRTMRNEAKVKIDNKAPARVES
jgi:HlyD family secretion protein